MCHGNDETRIRGARDCVMNLKIFSSTSTRTTKTSGTITKDLLIYVWSITRRVHSISRRDHASPLSSSCSHGSADYLFKYYH